MTYTKKQLIEKAIFAVWFSLDKDYGLYLYTLTTEEEADEHQIVADAWKTLAKYGMGIAEVLKHDERANNTVAAPVRFIDRVRPPFEAVETDDLPF